MMSNGSLVIHHNDMSGEDGPMLTLIRSPSELFLLDLSFPACWLFIAVQERVVVVRFHDRVELLDC